MTDAATWPAFARAAIESPDLAPGVGSRRRALLDGLADACAEISKEVGLPAGTVAWDPLTFAVRVMFPELGERAGEPLYSSPVEEQDGLDALRELIVVANTTERAMARLDRASSTFADAVVLPALFGDEYKGGSSESKGTEVPEPMEGLVGAPKFPRAAEDPVSVAGLYGGEGPESMLEQVAAEVLCVTESLTMGEVAPDDTGVRSTMADFFSILAARAVRSEEPWVALAFLELRPALEAVMRPDARDKLRSVLDGLADRAAEVAEAALVEEL